jgi:hypothetical protein
LARPFIDRNPTSKEVEKLRLLLSTYQDGTGMLQVAEGSTRPGWRDFERAAALALNGIAQESKAIFDVLLPDEKNPQLNYGLSCKMRGELNRINRDGRVTVEVANSASQFWANLSNYNLDQGNYKNSPNDVGAAIIETVNGWHDAVSTEHGGNIDVHKSFYLILSWNKLGNYQLHQFSLELPNPEDISWSFPAQTRGQNIGVEGRKLAGNDGTGSLFEWYGESGGQLKYYPLAENAIWASEIFQLEPLGDIDYGIINKARAYFPEQWERANAE